jgi:biopolymer transport protein ExbB
MTPILQSSSNFTVLGMLEGTDVVVKGVLAVLLLASLVTWTVWIAKGLELRRARSQLRRDVKLLESGQSLRSLAPPDGLAAAALSATVQEEVARAGDLAVPACGEGLKERTTVRLLSAETELARRMSRGIHLVASIGSTAPFVGLFGTVWGIMDSFIGISRSQATNLVVVAPGIAEALLTTAMGLAAAVPAVLIYNGFTRSISGYRAQLADASHALAGLLSLEVERAQLAALQGATRSDAAPGELPVKELARGI